jgi:enamine deaminase RidA (YjgF/YER057c/UK114 family)
VGHESNGLFNQVVVHDGTVYLAGQVAQDGPNTVAAQTREVLGQIDDRLALVGSDRSKVLSATIYLADIRTYDEMNQVWSEWVAPGALPVRATVEARLVPAGVLVEISVIAAVRS